MIPLLKFSDIKKNPQVLIFDHDYNGHAAIVRYGDVVGFVVPIDRMKNLIDAEARNLHLENLIENIKSGRLVAEDL